MCGINAVQLHGRLISADKDHVQPLAALDSFLPNGKKILIKHLLSTVVQLKGQMHIWAAI